MNFKESIPKEGLVLFSYFRSSSSWRVRTILNLKALPHTIVPINLLKGEQKSAEYKELNPFGSVPCLRTEGAYLAESMAIAEYLEERFPDNKVKLLPEDLILRARVRQICEIVNSEMQPLQNLRILNEVEQELKGDKMKWALKWNESGFEALEKVLKTTKGKHAVGDHITLADVFIVPQFMGAVARFGLDVSKYPSVAEIVDNVKNIDEFIKAFPENQIDFK